MRYILLAAAFLLASPALADPFAWAGNCQFSGGNTTGTIGTPITTTTRVGPGNIACLRFNSADNTFNSAVFTVAADSAVITFDPQMDAAISAATTARVIVHYCATGIITTAANPENDCIKIGGANGNADLDGTEGAATTQNAAIRVGPGIYYVEVTGACVAFDTCQVSVKGEGPMK